MITVVGGPGDGYVFTWEQISKQFSGGLPDEGVLFNIRGMPSGEIHAYIRHGHEFHHQYRLRLVHYYGGPLDGVERLSGPDDVVIPEGQLACVPLKETEGQSERLYAAYRRQGDSFHYEYTCKHSELTLVSKAPK